MFKMKSYNRFEFETKNFIVRYLAIEEDYPEDQLSEMDDDLADSINSDLNNGDLSCFTAELSVILKEENIVLADSTIGGNFYKDYEDFMDHYGLGYTSIMNRINNPKEGDDVHKLKFAIEQMNKNGYSPFGSYFRDLVKEVIQEAKSTQKYKTFFELKRKKEKIENF